MKVLILGALLAAGAAHARQGDADEARQLQAIGTLGADLYRFDRAAWVASDAAVAALKADDMSSLRGWVSERDADGAVRVTFFSGAGAARRAVFVATIQAGKVTGQERIATPRPLTAIQTRLADARDAVSAEAVRQGYRPCADKPFNLIVLPPETDDGTIRAYLLTPQTRAGSFPAGGHYRVDLDASDKVVASRAFTKTCLEAAPPPGTEGKVEMLAVSHLLDPLPTELHVFTSYTAQLPVAVVMPDKGLWVVTGPRIRRVKDK